MEALSLALAAIALALAALALGHSLRSRRACERKVRANNRKDIDGYFRVVEMRQAEQDARMEMLSSMYWHQPLRIAKDQDAA